MPHAFLLTNSCHTLLSCTILLACLISKFLFFKQPLTVSIHLLRNLPTATTSIVPYKDPLSYPVIFHSLHLAEPPENTLTLFITLHNSLIHAFRTLSILMIPSKPLRLSIYTAPMLDFFFTFHSIVSLPYVRTGIMLHARP